MDRGTGLPLILGNILFTIIAIVALRLGGWSGVATVAVTGAYLILSNIAIILTATGGLRDILLACVDRTARIVEIILLIALHRSRSRSRSQDDSSFELELPALEITPQISTDFRTFVPPVAPSLPTHEVAVKAQARAWLVSLFDEATGELDSHKVYGEMASASAGWLRERAPTGDVRKYLLSRGAIRQVANGFALNLDRVGNLRDVEGIIR